MNKQSNILGFSLVKVVTEQFSIIDENPEIESQIQLYTNFKFSVNPNDNVVKVNFLTRFICSERPFLQVEAGVYYRLSEETWNAFLESTNTAIKFPRRFACHLAMLTVGTTRGILHAKTEGTCLNKFVLPTIDVTKK